MKKIKYDVCVIGCGPAGFAAAMRSYDFGNHVVIVEGGHIGGAGIANGALSSKTMWELSKDFASANRIDRGYRASGLQVDYEKVRDNVFTAVRTKEYQIRSQIETFAKKEGRTKSVTLIEGWGKFSKDRTLVVTTHDGEDVEIEASSFIIASGSHPRKHPLLEVDGERIISSDHILQLKKFPKKILIVGAGIIGCEFATIFADFAQTRVYLLDSQERVIPFEDDDVSDYAGKMLEANGVNIFHKAKLRCIKKYESHIDVTLDYPDGHTQVISVDVILVSIGRVPTMKRLGLENIGIEIEGKRVIETDDCCRVCGNIYAAGDISGHAALVHIAEMEGRFAAKAIEEKIKFPLRYKNMSAIMFFNPEISTVGMSEKDCQKEKIAYKVVFYSHALVSRAIAMRSMKGFFKMIVTNEENPRILGMRAAGPQSSAAIMYIVTLMDHNIRLGDIMKTVHPHPNMTEGIQESIRTLLGKSIFKPEAFPQYIRFKTWEPDKE
ncbi:NAD(P)/FAD-dependent oxidoreductase [Sulfurimonas sp.]|uniref:dihydrolipoyl dehydrogenase family protein n=1 Tax=Sulfurimonas sp. TaxID=2022749 RepID=UPI002AB0E9E0|nr:NAD(P)/FAD-dependent oxidoreductase [Sulfurimonas sp.]